MTLPDRTTSLDAWTAALARPTLAPAGGSAAAIAGAVAAALVAMTAGLTTERERYAAVHPTAAALRDAAERLRVELLALASDDARVFAEFADALKLPTATEHEHAIRDAAKRRALAAGADVQLEVMRRAVAVIELGEQMAALGPPSALGDTATGTFLAAAALRAAYWAVRHDASGETDEGRDLLGRGVAAEQRMSELLRQRLR